MPDGSHTDAALLAGLLAGQQALHRELAELRAAIAPDLAQRADALAALRTAFAAQAFTCADALEVAARSPEGRVAKALLPLMGDPVGGVRRLSRRLAKMTGKPAGGLRLTRIGDDRGAALYVIETGQ